MREKTTKNILKNIWLNDWRGKKNRLGDARWGVTRNNVQLNVNYVTAFTTWRQHAHTFLCLRAGRKPFAAQTSHSRIHSGLPSLLLSGYSTGAMKAAKKKRSKKSNSAFLPFRVALQRWKEAGFLDLYYCWHLWTYRSGLHSSQQQVALYTGKAYKPLRELQCISAKFEPVPIP